MKLQGSGKLHLPPRCKGNSTLSTLYVISTMVNNNSQEDVLLFAPTELDCCLSLQEKEQLSEIPLNKPSTNIFFSVEDEKLLMLKLTKFKIDSRRKKKFEHFSLSVTTWGSKMLTILIFIVCICCFCCFKCCRLLCMPCY
jgi:hypothetical protein